ncbi:MAG: Rab family GTPase [Candidatus Thorarchaeota archaeon]
MSIEVNELEEEGQYKFKIILAGEGAVGKTTLINRFVHGQFKSDYKATIGVEITSKRLVQDQQDISLQIWDIAGQTLFRSIRNKFFSNARGALLVYDITIQETLESLHVWIRDIEAVTGRIPFVLIGNKSDLFELRTVSLEHVDAFRELETIPHHYDTSALTGENVEAAFSDLARLMVNTER